MFTDVHSLHSLRRSLRREIGTTHPDPEADSMASLVLDHLGITRDMILREPHREPSPEILAQIKEIVHEIHTNRPLQYILGHTQFRDLSLRVREGVLIPRPETEEMVHHILASQTLPPARVLDLGTGSGCLALALKQIWPEARVQAVDISEQALAVARENGLLNRLDVDWIRADLRDTEGIRTLVPDPGPRGWDLIVSNPPYVRESEARFMQANVLDHEPKEALFVPDQDPLLHYRAIAALARTTLNPGGHLWLEINEFLGKETLDLFRDLGPGTCRLVRDIHDKNRFLHVRTATP
ncbi:MAG: peptide chain release factor N(5)-glutamine methyltransferase [Bacteroidales bacterium]